jgi:hypothetical protein
MLTKGKNGPIGKNSSNLAHLKFAPQLALVARHAVHDPRDVEEVVAELGLQFSLASNRKYLYITY